MIPMLLDIGTGELVALVVLAAILLGPEKVPALAKKLGRIIGFLRRVANTATDQIKAELGPEYANLDLQNLKDLNPKNLIQQVIPSDVQSEMDSLRAQLAAMQSDMNKLKQDTTGDVAGISDLLPTAAELKSAIEGGTRTGNENSSATAGETTTDKPATGSVAQTSDVTA